MGNVRDILAFWIFGLANNFAYVIMLSAAEDIIRRQSGVPEEQHANATLKCMEDLGKPRCEKLLSTGAVLLADIVPALVIKFTCPFFINRVPFGFRHFLVCSLQALSYLVVAFSTSTQMSLVGVVFASCSSGLGEICYLALSSHYTKTTIAAWSSGTGGAGIVGSLAYAVLTEPKLFGLSPRNALLSMLVVPIVFLIAYWLVLTPSPSVHQMSLCSPNTWIVPTKKKRVTSGPSKISPPRCELPDNGSSTSEGQQQRPSTFTHEFSFALKLRLIHPLLRLMVPLSLVYLTEYLINSGLHQLVHFDCAHGFGLANASQFRWYQMLYQLGVFTSRSSVTLLALPVQILYLLPVLQFANVVIFYLQAVYSFIPHIAIVFAIIYVEGLFGGASYVNTFHRIHNEAPEEVREFSMAIASSADSLGITIAGFLSIAIHNYICLLYEKIYP